MNNFLFKIDINDKRWLTVTAPFTQTQLAVIPDRVDQGDIVTIEASFETTVSNVSEVEPAGNIDHSFLFLEFFPAIPSNVLTHVEDLVFNLNDEEIDINDVSDSAAVRIISRWQLNTEDCGNAGYSVQAVIKDFRIQKFKGAKAGTAPELSVRVTKLPPAQQLYIQRSALNANNSINASLTPSATPFTRDIALWLLILKGTKALSFENYMQYMDFVFCGTGQINNSIEFGQALYNLRGKRLLPFTDTDAYRSLKVATEAFLMVNCGVNNYASFSNRDVEELYSRVSLKNGDIDKDDLDRFWEQYLVNTNGASDVLPYLAIIRRKLSDQGIKTITMDEALDGFDSDGRRDGAAGKCVGIISNKLASPCFLELIWSYWHEESMMIQGMNAIARRFQNVRGNGNDPLANLEIDPLRPLNNLIWGYIQDEQHRLSVVRRTLEYDHHYGISLQGKAVGNLRTADSRSKFIEAFHNLLNTTVKFYKQLDDTTVVADGFPVLNVLKEVHLILSEGAHNQFGDLPSTARIEMLMQQWLFARAEFREFLPTRIMVAYPEAWMDRVAALNTMQGWTKTSVLHFRDLGVFGEQLLLSIRFGNWASISDRNQAANWAKFWREQIQGYIHAYRAVSGVDLSREDGNIDFHQPSVHLLRKLKEQNSKLRA